MQVFCLLLISRKQIGDGRVSYHLQPEKGRKLVRSSFFLMVTVTLKPFSSKCFIFSGKIWLAGQVNADPLDVKNK